MINPEYKQNWRPTHDLGRQFEIQPEHRLLEAYQPTDAADAIAYLIELALPEIVAYVGHPCQAEMLHEQAVAEWPHLFADTGTDNWSVPQYDAALTTAVEQGIIEDKLPETVAVITT